MFEPGDNHETPIYKPKSPSVTLGIAKPSDYGYLLSKGWAGLLEEGERKMFQCQTNAFNAHDASTQRLLDTDPGLSNQVEDLQDHLEQAYEKILERSYDLQILSLPEPFEETEEMKPLIELEFQYGNQQTYKSLLNQKGFGALLAKYIIETQTLQTLSSGWWDLAEVRESVGLESTIPVRANRNPYAHAQKRLRTDISSIVAESINNIAESVGEYSWKNPENLQAARDQAVLKALTHYYPFAMILTKKDSAMGFTQKQVITHTKDPESGITFITQIGFNRKNDTSPLERWGTVGISGFGPQGEIYYLTPQYREPQYSSKTGDKPWDESFHPFFRGKGTYSGWAPSLTEEKELAIWQAYRRAKCDIKASKEAYIKETDWRYSFTEAFWGADEAEVKKYTQYQTEAREAWLRQSAFTTDLGYLRWGIRHEESIPENDTEANNPASEETLNQILLLYNRFHSKPEDSPFDISDGGSFGYAEFSIPARDKNESGIKVRLSHSNILLTDAPLTDESIARRRYLQVSWNNNDQWQLERGWRSDTNDAYFLEPDSKKKDNLTTHDAKTVLLALKQL